MGAKSKKTKKKAERAAEALRAVHTAAGNGRPASMSALDAIAQRRTHKQFTARPVERAEIEALLDAAVLAPNHKMTEPWRFVVLGPESRLAYAELRARAKVGATADGEDEKAAVKRARIVEELLEVPAFIMVLMHQDDDEFRRDEDHAAVWMGVQNMLLAATALGLGTKIATGRVFETDELRALVDARKRERVLGVIHVGEPLAPRQPKDRTPAAKLTTWLG